MLRKIMTAMFLYICLTSSVSSGLGYKICKPFVSGVYSGILYKEYKESSQELIERQDASGSIMESTEESIVEE